MRELSYTFFVECGPGEESPYRVHFEDPSGETEGYSAFLRPGTRADLQDERELYVLVPEGERYCVSAVAPTLEDLVSDAPPRGRIYFAEAILCFRPFE